MDWTECDEYIRESLEKGIAVEQVKLLGTTCESEAEIALEELIDNGWDEEITLSAWFNHVEDYKKTNPIPIEIKSSTLGDVIEDINLTQLVNNPHSSWRALKVSFARNGLSSKSIQEIERSAHSVLERISPDTRQRDPIKGLVFGSVQSGKTANMEALISMAADTHWNIFIILSGTIESLRVQTRDRFKRDLQTTSAVAWRHIDLSGDERGFTTSQMKLNVKGDFTHGTRYVITCLKQKSRLTKLINWLYADPSKARRMRAIVIDDEADQASINTAPILDGEDAELYEQNRKEINRLIVCLANGLLPDGSTPRACLQSMNYISYTATPYANVLNEKPGKSLYPKDFVHSLSAPDEYFGINVIFGNPDYIDEDGKPLAPGLDIIRTIPKTDDSTIKSSHKDCPQPAPKSLQTALCWFLCCAAVLRYRKHRKPISMLIHTSNIGKHHEIDYHMVRNHLDQTPAAIILEQCREIYSTETKLFTKADLARDFSSYGLLDQVPDDFPAFSSISNEIEKLIKNIEHIAFAGDGAFRYSAGINICIDDCYADRDAPDSIKMRLVYPTDEQLKTMESAPVFIVIGGNTLARGLTIEGLTCSYFTRNATQADTLMQMARWFGYRKGYELLQRIWLTHEIKQKYHALSKVEMNLKEEIKRFEELAIRPDELGVKVLTIPEIRKFMLTAKNKMQSATACEYNFTGQNSEITAFDNDPEKLNYNLELTEQFLERITPAREIVHKPGSVIWRDVPTEYVIEYISQYSVSSYSSLSANDIANQANWIKGSGAKRIDCWNVAVAGKTNSPSGTWSCAGVQDLPRIERSCVAEQKDCIDIGSLRSGVDALCDIEFESLSPEQLLILNEGGKNSQTAAKRAKLGFEKTPLLLIYRIDSASTLGSGNRRPIDTDCDIISFATIIPGDKFAKSGIKAVSIDIAKE